MFDSLQSVIAVENLTVVDHAPSASSDDLFFSQIDLTNALDELSALESAYTTIDNLDRLQFSIESFGVTQSLLSFTNRDHLLSTAIPAIGACEALGADVPADSYQAKAAQEAVLEKIKDTAAAFFKRTWELMTAVGDKMVHFTDAVYHKAVDVVKWIGTKAYDGAMATKDTIKAHLIASGIAALSLVSGVAATVGLIWSLPLPASMSAVTEWMAGVRSKISGTLGGQKVAFRGDDIVLEGGILPPIKTETAAQSGYTETKCKFFAEKTREVFRSDGNIASMARGIGAWVKKAWDAAGSHGKDALSAVRRAFWFLVKMTRALYRFLSGPVIAVVTSVMSVVTRLFNGKKAAPADAATLRQPPAEGGPA